jgi:phosphoglycerate dehydrogenase-like enzyme
MTPASWIVNIARGGLIDQDALVAALHAGRPRGAYFDVTEPEPLPPDHAVSGEPGAVPGRTGAGKTSPISRQAADFLRGGTGVAATDNFIESSMRAVQTPVLVERGARFDEIEARAQP